MIKPLTLLIDLPTGRTVHTLERATVIGRADEVDLMIDHPTVSRRHALIEPDGLIWTMVDLGSTNGSRINGDWITGVVPLSDGDVLRIGRVKARVFFGPARVEPADSSDTSPGGRVVRCVCGKLVFAPDVAPDFKPVCDECGQPIDAALTGDIEERSAGESTCPVCHSSIAAGEKIVCPSCGVEMHVECWEAAGGCASYGCDQAGSVSGRNENQ